jgi:hypothetical protein
MVMIREKGVPGRILMSRLTITILTSTPCGPSIRLM